MHNGMLTVLLAKSGARGGIDTSVLWLLLILVGTFAMLLLLFTMRKNILPVFRLWYILLFHGKFSFEFIEFFKEKNLRNPLNNCIRDEITLHFLIFFKKIRNAGEFSTGRRIEFTSFPFISAYRALLKQRGKPDCINITRFQKSRVLVVGYQEIIADIKAKALYFFIDDKFALGEYFVADITRLNPQHLLHTVAGKYLDGVVPEMDSFYITDPEGNQLNYENNGFSLSVRYISRTNEQINSLLENLFVQNKQGNPQLRKTLIQEELYGRF